MTSDAARVLPHSLDAERAVLGAVLLRSTILDDVAAVVTADQFYRAAHRTMFAHMVTLRDAHVSIDFVTLRDALERSGSLDDCGGPAYVSSLIDGMPVGSNAIAYAHIVSERARLRDIIKAGSMMIAEAYDSGNDAAGVIERAEAEIFRLGEGRSEGGFRRFGEILPDLVEQVERWHSSDASSGLETGFTAVDDMTRGFQPGNLIVIGARPGMGKSALVSNILQHVAKSFNADGARRVAAVFSLEMSEIELGTRILSSEAGINSHHMQGGRLNDFELTRFAEAVVGLSQVGLYVDASPTITISEMRSRARRLKSMHGLDLVVVDYMQLMIGEDAKGRRAENRTLELAAISRGLKIMAKELRVPVVALSQLSRAIESRKDKRPMLSDLRDSGAIEQDADVVLFIYRGEQYEQTESNRGKAEIIIGKQRMGPVGTVMLGWVKEQTRFTNIGDEQPEPEQAEQGMLDRW